MCMSVCMCACMCALTRACACTIHLAFVICFETGSLPGLDSPSRLGWLPSLSLSQRWKHKHTQLCPHFPFPFNLGSDHPCEVALHLSAHLRALCFLPLLRQFHGWPGHFALFVILRKDPKPTT